MIDADLGGHVVKKRVALAAGEPMEISGGTTTEADLAVQQAEDDAEAMHDAARYVRRVRRRLGLTQQEFARRIDVPLDAALLALG